MLCCFLFSYTFDAFVHTCHRFIWQVCEAETLRVKVVVLGVEWEFVWSRNSCGFPRCCLDDGQQRLWELWWGLGAQSETNTTLFVNVYNAYGTACVRVWWWYTFAYLCSHAGCSNNCDLKISTGYYHDCGELCERSAGGIFPHQSHKRDFFLLIV